MSQKSDVKQLTYDVVIIGGGMVGAAQAVAMAKQKKQVLLIENTLPTSELLDNLPLRVSAINLASEAYLTSLDIWSNINPQSLCMFEQLVTWENRHQPLVFSASDINEEHLGYLIRNEALQLAAFEQIHQLHKFITVLTDTSISAISQIENEVVIEVTSINDNKQTNLHCSLLIGADGAFSQVRSMVEFGTTGWDYEQQCLSITIKTEFPTQHVTWQEFQPSGPKAFLPLENGYATLIWYDSKKVIEQLKTLNNEQLKQRVLTVFPPLAGEFAIEQKASFPLTRRQANQYHKGRVVLIGDAAHTINPLAGQGVNIGYKDVETLTKLLLDVDITNCNKLTSALVQYQTTRKRESLIMSGAMDSFYTLFSNDKAPLKLLRSTLLSVANQFEWAKKQVLKKAVGY